MKLNEYLTENGVKLMIKGSGENYSPRQTNDLGMYDSPVKNFSTSKPNVTNLTRYTTNAAPAISFGLLPL